MINKALCPSCEKETELTSSNPYRPFCSKRCRLIDLGEWISENYSISENSIGDEITQTPEQKH